MKLTKDCLLKLQKEISEQIISVATREICANRHAKLVELNLRLDSINRAEFYLNKGKLKDETKA